MKYSSLQEFFYKLQNVLYLLILFPLLVFIFFFVYETYRPEVVSEEQMSSIYVALAVFIVIDLSVASFIFYTNLKAIRKIGSLGLRLEKYYAITVLRFSLVSFADLILIAGYFLTGNLIFAILFGVSLVFFLLSWPRTSKVCADLKLKGDEREMVYYKKMNLH